MPLTVAFSHRGLSLPADARWRRSLSGISDIRFEKQFAVQVKWFECMSAVPHLENRPFPVKTALVVDVDPHVEAVLTGTLNPESWCIRHAPDNAAALTLAEAIPLDLILTNEKTSRKDALDVLRQVRRVRRQHRLTI